MDNSGTVTSAFQSQDLPLAYEEFFVGRLFGPWTKLLLGAVEARTGEWLLDVATGPGTVARIAAPMLGPSGRVVATDFSETFLAVARSKPPLDDAAAIEYVVSPAAPLAVRDAQFDVAACQQGLQFFPDRNAALAEMRRALKPRGRLGIAVWTAIDRNDYFAELHDAVSEILGADAAAPLLAPFSFPDPGALDDVIREAGFQSVRVITKSLPLAFEGGLDQAVRALTATPVAPLVSQLDAATRRALDKAAARRLSRFVRDGEVHLKMESNIATAVK